MNLVQLFLEDLVESPKSLKSQENCPWTRLTNIYVTSTRLQSQEVRLLTARVIKELERENAFQFGFNPFSI